MLDTFTIAALPKIQFGPGTIATLADEIRAQAPDAKRVLIVTGAKSFTSQPAWPQVKTALAAAHLDFETLAVPGEPSPELVDEAVQAHKDGSFGAVVGIGGGSALDAAKAIAGLLVPANTVMDHLEGVGPELPYAGPALPFIAVPTTAGTGSEATKNAVLSRHGQDGFKKSFRDDQLVARVAIVDPDLLASCPKGVVAANGMDAFTQLLESLASIKSNPITAALAWSGLARFARGFWDMHLAAPDHAGILGDDTERARDARADMAYASLISGICLAQTGLGSVHGLAQPLGSLFPIPHGVVCGTLVGDATAINIRALIERAPDSPALEVYARAGQILAGGVTGNAALDALVRTLHDWTDRLGLARLSEYGVTENDVERIVANSRGSSMTTNPVVLTDAEIAELVRCRL